MEDYIKWTVDKLKDYIKNASYMLEPSFFKYDLNCLCFAVKSNNPEMVKQVYQCLSVLLHTKDHNGKTPLEDVAAKGNHVEEFYVLIKQVTYYTRMRY